MDIDLTINTVVTGLAKCDITDTTLNAYTPLMGLEFGVNSINIPVQIEQTTELNRNTIDKYYTKPNIATQCIELIKTHVTLNANDLIIEPSAGNGSFITQIKTLSPNYIFYDLEPEHEEIIRQDFLELNITQLLQPDKPITSIHVIGNPPFGRQSSLAIKFIKKCCMFAKSISFILPKSFKKESMRKHFAKKYHLIYEQDLPTNSFLVNNIECDVPCVFQIWMNMPTDRNELIKLAPQHFKFVKKEEEPDISFRRVGVNAGNISTDIINKSEQSHYFIKFTNGITIVENLDKLKNITFSFNNTVGAKSISKGEVITQFNRFLIHLNNNPYFTTNK